MNKKEYMMPAMTVVVLKHRTMLLCGSDYNDIKTPVQTFEDPEEVITDKGSIW